MVGSIVLICCCALIIRQWVDGLYSASYSISSRRNDQFTQRSVRFPTTMHEGQDYKMWRQMNNFVFFELLLVASSERERK